MSLDFDTSKKNLSIITTKISAIHYFLHVHSLLFAQHFITFHQPKSNQLNCELLLFLEKFE